MPGRLNALGLAFAAILGLAAPAAATSSHVDEQALRYYAARGEASRAAAEARRLSRLDPTWRPPADLAEAKPTPEDEAPLWDMYRHGRLDDIARAIAERQAAEPRWAPSAELLAKIKTSRLRASIMDLARQGRWSEIVTSAKAAGRAWAADDAQALWTLAEAAARENDAAEAYAIYHDILAGHDSADERRATIEFAIPLIPMALTEKLIAMGRTDASGRSEFAAISIDITRARISAFLHDEPAVVPSEADLAAFGDFARAATSPDEAGLVAWYAYRCHNDALALDWFKIAIARGGDAMIAHGLAHTLRRLDRRREAEEVAYAWREPLVNNSILFIDLLETELTRARPPFVEPELLTRYAQVTLETESGEGAQALAWYAYNTCQYATALRWFERATAWLPKEATVYGYALALERLHRRREFRDVVNRYDGLFPKVVALAFDTRLRTPPPTCETRPMESAAALDWTERSLPGPSLPTVTVTADPVPSPIFVEAAQGSRKARKRTAFPVAVDPENMLRFASDGEARRLGEPRTTAGLPLIARRVPGVGAMPYERFGQTLLPGYDGTREASSPTAAERDAPKGTLWAFERSSPSGPPPPRGDQPTKPISEARR